jgi:hypothetical protein
LVHVFQLDTAKWCDEELNYEHICYSAFGKSLCTYKFDGSDVHERLYRPEPELNWIKQLNTLPVLHFNRRLTTEYSETTAHFNDNFDTYNQIYVP